MRNGCEIVTLLVLYSVQIRVTAHNSEGSLVQRVTSPKSGRP